jgi:protein-arginine deiminase
VTNKDRVRLFVKIGTRWFPVKANTVLDATALGDGVRLGLEARDIVRDPKTRNGTTTVTLTVTVGGTESTDTVRLQVAPMLSHHHLQAPEEVWVMDAGERSQEGRSATSRG